MTEDEDFVESFKNNLKKNEIISAIHVKEYGLQSFITDNCSDYIVLLKKHFPEHWKFIVACSYSRLAYQMDKFYEKQYGFGTLTILTDLGNEHSAENIFNSYKQRNQVETMIDAFKNIIDADASYMQNDKALEAWMFINYIVLHWYYKITNQLKQLELNSKYSAKDIIQFLTNIKMVKINNSWHLETMTKKKTELFNLLRKKVKS